MELLFKCLFCFTVYASLSHNGGSYYQLEVNTKNTFHPQHFWKRYGKQSDFQSVKHFNPKALINLASLLYFLKKIPKLI